MSKRFYESPILRQSESGGAGNVVGEGSGQGSFAPWGMPYEDWWEEIAMEGNNPDADYNYDGQVDIEDWKLYSDPNNWNGNTFEPEP